MKRTPKKLLPRPFASMLVVAVLLVLASAAGGADQQVLGPIDKIASDSLKSLQASDPAGAAESLKLFEPEWSKVEDGVRAKDPDVYARIEVESSRAAAALEAEPPDNARAAEALSGLASAVHDYGKGTG